MTQAERNPFPASNSNKRYRTYDYELKRKFGEKVAKLSLDGGFTCPNRDGTRGSGGCIFCSARGSGDFASSPAQSIREQAEAQKRLLSGKWSAKKFIAYFQAFTNTYAPVDVLRKLYEEALAVEGVVGLNIATRADCLPPDVVDLLAEFAGRTSLCVEIGLQTTDDRTAERINRCYPYSEFAESVARLRRADPAIAVCVHLIFGLPGEDRAVMLDSVRKVAALRPEQVKFHLLHVLRGTPLADLWARGEYMPLDRETYLSLLADALELLPPETAVARLTGDGKAKDLLAPLWSRDKRSVLNGLDQLLFSRNSWQGKAFPPDGRS